MATNPLGRLINLFFMTHRSLHKHMQEAKVITAFSFLQFIAMKFVSEGGQASMKDLARFLSITPASATSLVNGLVRMGVLERIADASDRRVILLRPTAHGRKALNRTDSQAKKELKRIFLQLSDNDRKSLTMILEKLFAVLSREKISSSTRRASVNET
jgi:DNA-binding MarR family transcriptional regulator